VGAAAFVYETLRAARDRGLGVLLFSLDLDEIFALSDRIAVMFNGRLAGILPRAAATPEKVGALMTGTEGSDPQMTQMTQMKKQDTAIGQHSPLPPGVIRGPGSSNHFGGSPSHFGANHSPQEGSDERE
jgi:ABC-type sulfate/molybdate transport systems ATPase subunit